MNCQRFDDAVSELAREQMMDAELRTQALSHADECSRCHQHLQSQLSLTQGLRAVAERTGFLNASDALELRLRKAMHERDGSASPAAIASSRRGLWLAIAAAVLLLVGSVIAISWQREKSMRGNEEFVVKPPRSSEAEKPTAIGDSRKEDLTIKEAQPTVAKKQNKPRRSSVPGRLTKNETEVLGHHTGEVATDFIPIGYVNSASFQEGGQIVRVELPRSALARFGLPVNMDRLNEKVKADVWLGVDGLAHAIRFVQ